MWAAIGDLVGKVEQRHPTKLGRDWIAYLDISSIDRESKRIIAVQRIRAHSAPSRARQVVCADDILVSTVRPNLNAVASVPGFLDGQIASTGFCVLRPNPRRVCPRYLFYYSQTETFVSHLSKVATGASYPAVTDSDVLEMPVPLPPLSEQKRFAGLLEQADRLRRTRRYTLELSNTFLPAVFLELFGKDALADSRVCKLGEITNRITNGYVGPTRDIYVEKGVPYILSKHVKANELTFDGQTFVTEEFNQKNRKSILKAGDVLLVQTGHIGESAVVPPSHEGHNCHALIVISPVPDRLDGHYLNYFLSSPIGKDALRRIQTGATLEHLNCGDVELINLPVPNLKKQKHFTELLARHERVRANQREEVRQADHLFQSLLHRAFTTGI